MEIFFPTCQLQRKPSVMVSQENEKQIALQWQAPV